MKSIVIIVKNQKVSVKYRPTPMKYNFVKYYISMNANKWHSQDKSRLSN